MKVKLKCLALTLLFAMALFYLFLKAQYKASTAISQTLSKRLNRCIREKVTPKKGLNTAKAFLQSLYLPAKPSPSQQRTVELTEKGYILMSIFRTFFGKCKENENGLFGKCKLSLFRKTHRKCLHRLTYQPAACFCNNDMTARTKIPCPLRLTQEERFAMLKLFECHCDERNCLDSLQDTEFNDCSGNAEFEMLKSIRDRCTKHPHNKKIDLSRMVYDDRHKVVMCVVPKDACTTWKRYMWFLMGKVKNMKAMNEIPLQDLVLNTRNNPTPTLRSLSTEEALKRLLTYTTFFVTRHPFERLLSAYNSKFSSALNEKTSYMHHYGKKVAIYQARYFLKGLSYSKTSEGFVLNRDSAFHQLNASDQLAALQYISIMNTGNITFPQLIKDVVEWKSRSTSYDVHWRPQVDLCNPCAMKYDYVIRFENLAKDSNFLLDYLQQNDPVSQRMFFDTNRTSYVDSKKTSIAFSTLDEKQIKQLRSIYEKDFNIMGYAF